MIALHWTVFLPRDYDLDRVRERVRAEAPTMDVAPGLVLFAHGLRAAGASGVAVHRYSTVSVWSNTSRMGAYLWDDGGFERVRAQYGAVDVRLWSIAGLQLDRSKLERADRMEVASGSARRDEPLSRLAGEARTHADRAMRSRDIHAAVRALDPASGAAFSVDLRSGISRNEEGLGYTLVHLSVPPPPR